MLVACDLTSLERTMAARRSAVTPIDLASMNATDALGVVALRSRAIDHAIPAVDEVAVVWVAALLYAFRSGQATVALTDRQGLARRPGRSDARRLVARAYSLSTAWPGSEFPSLGMELEKAITLDIPGRVYVRNSPRVTHLQDVTFLQRNHRLTLSNFHIGARGKPAVHAGVSVQLVDAVQVREPELYEQILLHEMLKVADHYAPLHGELVAEVC